MDRDAAGRWVAGTVQDDVCVVQDDIQQLVTDTGSGTTKSSGSRVETTEHSQYQELI